MEKGKERIKNNPEKYAETRKKYREKNKDKLNEYSKNYARKNPEKRKIIYKRYHENNPRVYDSVANKIQWDKRKIKNHKITKSEWIACKTYFNFNCAYCGRTEDEQRKIYNQQLNKEHVICDGENDLSNCVPACKSCNASKWDHKFEDWYVEDNPVYSEERKIKILKWLNEDYKKFIGTKEFYNPLYVKRRLSN